MVNKRFWLGILVLVLVLGFTVIGCGEEDVPPPPPQPPQPGDTSSNPIDRVESIDLGDMTSENSGWKQLLNSIQSSMKYINLDLSACTMDGTSFDPAPTVIDATGRIVSIILPEAATSIADGTSSSGTFRDFFNLISISGANINTIGKYAFNYTGSVRLQTVNFPEVTTIDEGAFYLCSNLTTLNFPKVTTIGKSAFGGCIKLTTLDIPKVTSIGEEAFMRTYSESTYLTITMGTTAPTLGTSLFRFLSSSITVTVKVPAGATGYTPFTGTTITVSSGNTQNWANGFRGAGWNGSAFVGEYIYQNITLTIQSQ
ncbi:hypothetical protein R84B8_02327 [Treponema sp. R8-4-B8]